MSMNMLSAERISDIMCAVPSYTEAQITFTNGKTVKGLARDYPGEGRRWTIDFFEWFITPEVVANAIQSVEFEPFVMHHLA